MVHKITMKVMGRFVVGKKAHMSEDEILRRNPLPTRPGRPARFYHVSLTRHEEAILTEGLVPQIGPRAEDLGETQPAIYLFPSQEDMDNALMNWLGEELPEDEWITAYEITLPADFPVEPAFPDAEESWEWVTHSRILPQWIRVIWTDAIV